MPLWTANDDPTGLPKWTSREYVLGANSTNNRVYGVSKAMAQDTPWLGKGVSQGWVTLRFGTGGVSSMLIANTGSGYANADTISVDGNGTVGVINASATIVVGFSANLAGTVAILSAGANAIASSANLLALYTNGDFIFAYTNSTAADSKKINQVVNSSFLNITSTWSATNAASSFGVSGQIQTITVNTSGSGFTNTSNVTVTTSTGVKGTVTPVLGGKAGRIFVDNTVVLVGDIKNPVANSVFP